MYMLYRQAGRWQWMAHGSLWVANLDDAGDRGHSGLASINWMMAMGRRQVGSGRVTLRAMASIEPWTVGGCGYPDLLASGEVCDGEAIVDQQHPHDAVMELALVYDHPIRSTVRWFVYGGPAGEPSLGPPAFPHRPSAQVNPIAPIAHHWLDSSHITYGVITAGVYGSRWKAESSLFNGREPDQHRRDLDLGPLDSFAGRVTFAPTSNLSLQASAGHLSQAEAAHGSEPSRDVTRVTASALLQGTVSRSGWWGATLAWARNSEDQVGTQAALAEVTVMLDERHAMFGRAEINSKEAHDLSLHGPRQVFTVAKFQGGYTRYLRPIGGAQVGVGGLISAGLVPEALRTVFGSRVNVGYGVVFTIRPARHQM
jgi:hypothetical protein